MPTCCASALRAVGLTCILLVILVVVLAIMLVMRSGRVMPDYQEYVGGSPVQAQNSLEVQEPWISLIAGKNGVFKTVEGRPCPAEKWLSKITEPITFTDAEKKVEALITGVRHYDTLKAYLDAEWKKAVPQAKTREEAEAIYMSIQMKSRDSVRDGAPVDTVIRVFDDARVALRGGITAIEFVLRKPCGGLAWLVKELSSPVDKNRKEARRAIESIKSFLKKYFSEVDAQKMIDIVKFRGRVGWRDGRIMAELKKISEVHKERIVRSAEAKKGARARSRQSDIEEELGKLTAPGEVKRYLDVGCAEGSLTEAIADVLKVPPEGTFGCDLSPTKPANFTERGTYVQASAEALPFPDNHFDAASFVMSLHHFPSVPRALAEIRRVVVPGGLVIIREHDSHNPAFSVYLDFVHYVYTILLHNEIVITPSRADSDLEAQQLKVVGRYRPANEWTKIITDEGFEEVGLVGSGGKNVSKDRFRSFYAFYRAK